MYNNIIYTIRRPNVRNFRNETMRLLLAENTKKLNFFNYCLLKTFFIRHCKNSFL